MQDWIKVFMQGQGEGCVHAATLHFSISVDSEVSPGFLPALSLVVLNEGESSLPAGLFGYLETIWQFLLVTAGGGCYLHLVQRGGDAAGRSTQDNLAPLPPAKNQPTSQQGPG